MWLRRILAVGRQLDWIMLSAAGILMIIGLAALYSIARGGEQPDFSFFYRQLLFVGVGVFVMIVAICIDYRRWRELGWVAYVLMIIFLIAVLFFGQVVNGTRGWFNIAGFRFQPVEFAKIALILFLANTIAKQVSRIQSVRVFFYDSLGYAISICFGTATARFWIGSYFICHVADCF